MTIFNKFFDNKFKDIDLKASTSNASGGIYKSNNTTTHRKTKDFSVINKGPKVITVLEQDINSSKNHFNKNSQIFYSYLEKLKKITSDVKKLNEAKLFKVNNTNYIHSNLTHKEELLNSYKFVGYKLKSMTKNMKDNSTNSSYNSLVDTTNLDTKVHPKISINEHKVVHNNEQYSLYNKFISEVNSKIDYLIKVLTPYLEVIVTKLSNFNDNKYKVSEEFFNNIFKDLNNNVLDIKKLCDLNGMDIDNLNDSLSKVGFYELIKILKEINVNTNKLVDKLDKLSQDSVTVSNEIKNLESHLKVYSKEHLDALTKQINTLEEKQSEYSIIQTESKDTIINEIKNVLYVLNSTSNPTLELQDKLNTILAKQENLLEEALNIKSYVTSNKKNMVEECNQSEKGLHVLIEEIKSNNTVVKEQNVFSEKIQKDMEIIKKSIIGLVDKHTKENSKILNTTVESKSLGYSVPRQVNKLPSNEGNFLNNKVNKNESENNVKKVDQDIYSSKVTNNKDVQKFNQVKNAIGKLKEALDLDAIHTVKELHTEYIDEIIEENLVGKQRLENVQSNSKTGSNNYSTDQNKDNFSKIKSSVQKTNKSSQGTLILDNSKFFK